MLDLTRIPIVDAHCHPFYLTAEPLGLHDLEDQVGLLAAHTPHLLFPAKYHTRLAAAVGPERRALEQEYRVAETWDHLRRSTTSTVFYHLFLKRLAGFLGCEPTVAATTAARNSAAVDPGAYVRRLLHDAGVAAVVIDEGMPRPLDVDRFVQTMPVPVYRLLNMRVLLEDVLAALDGFDDAVEGYTGRIRDAVRHRGYVGLKSHIAYTSGLDVARPDAARARAAFASYAQGDASAWKDVDSYFFRVALREARDLGVPVQIHTGLGGSGIHINRCNPLLLEDVLKDDALHGVTLVLLHGAYPWAAEAGWLANAFPYVYVDISFQLPYAHVNVRRRLRELLELAPLSKVTYGSDAYLFPDLMWLSAHLAREHLSAVLSDLVQEGTFSVDEACDTALALLHDNASRLYRLPAGLGL